MLQGKLSATLRKIRRISHNINSSTLPSIRTSKNIYLLMIEKVVAYNKVLNILI